jgi:hypothetical protein
MKEIDFLPEWYKSGRQRQISYRTQVLGLGGILVIMIVWNFVTTASISRAGKEVEKRKAIQAEAESVSLEFATMKSDVTELQKKVKSMEKMDSKIDVAAVLAEMSFLINENIILGKVEFNAEKFVDEQESPGNAVAVRVVSRKSVGGEKLPLGDVRFKVVISGVARDAGDIADLICKLEESPYFCLVYPSFSRNKKMTMESVKDLQVSEFEISCYLANYRKG